MPSFVDKYVEYAKEQTDAPEIFHKFIAYVVLGNAVGKSAYIQRGPKRFYPNFYMLIVAPSTKLRKSSALTVGKNLMVAWNPERIWDSNMSDEALMNLLGDREHGVIVEDEFQKLLLMSEKNYAINMRMTLTDLYDSPSYKPPPARVKSPGPAVRYPAPSILSTSTESALYQAMTPEDFSTGFFARFVFVTAFTKERELNDQRDPDQGMARELDRHMRAVKDNLTAHEEHHRKVTLSREASSEYASWGREWDEDMERNIHEYRFIEPNLARLKDAALKFALLNAVQEDRHEVSLDDMYHAEGMASSSKLAVVEILKDFDPFQGTFDQRLALLKRALRLYARNGKKMSTLEFTRYFSERTQVSRARDILEYQRYIRINNLPNGGQEVEWIDDADERLMNEAERIVRGDA